MNHLNKKLCLSIIASLILFFYSCNRDGFLVSESGLHYTIHESKGGAKPKVGDVMSLNLLYKTANDSVLFNSMKMGKDFTIELQQPSYSGGPEEAFAMLGEGDSASFLINADSLYEKTFKSKRPAYIHRGEKLKFEVRMIKVISKKDYEEMHAKELMHSEANEEALIRKYLADNNLFVKPLPSGLVFISYIEGKGKKPVIGSEVEVKYTATFLTSELFDETNDKTGPLKFNLGDGSMIDAWEQGLLLMREGGVARLVIPSKLAYAEKGYGPIKPNTPIVYNVTLLSVK